jgi:3-phenylpropionate/cinnamic acid dioxygenase small subunit
VLALDIVEKIQIQELLTKYCYAVDDKNWEAFTELFTETSVLDFTAFGGPRCGAKDMAIFLSGMASGVKGWQHTISTMLIQGQGDNASVRTAAQVNMISQENSEVSFIGLWYRDIVVKTQRGWKIQERVQEYGWVHNMPTSA